MKKLTKKERAEQYLNDFANTEAFDVERLDKMTVYDLLEIPELKGIGKTTLSVALKSLKKTHGLKKEVLTELEDDKKKVERYLNMLINMENFTPQDLMDLSVYDLLGNAELEGIEKSTLSDIIRSFKKDHLEPIKEDSAEKEVQIDILEMSNAGNEDFASKEGSNSAPENSDVNEQELFESALINAIEEESAEKEKEKEREREREKEKEKEREKEREREREKEKEKEREKEREREREKEKEKEREKEKEKEREKEKEKEKEKKKEKKKEDKYELKLQKDDLSILKEIISEYKKGRSKLNKTERREFSELKRALKHFGIDYKKIVEQYRKISAD